MRAYRFDRLDSLDDLKRHDEAMPAPQRGEVLVKIRRCVSLDYRDLSVVLGNYVGSSQAGLIPCSDAAPSIRAGMAAARRSPSDVKPMAIAATAGLPNLRWCRGRRWSGCRTR